MSTNEPAAGGRDLEALRRGVETLLEQEPAGPERTATEGRLQAMLAQMVADGARREDPIREVMARLGDKWSPLLLLLLAAGSFRHATLRRLVGLTSTEGRISQRMLTLRLRAWSATAWCAANSSTRTRRACATSSRRWAAAWWSSTRR
ncbi:MAG: hypothetical protein U1F06_05440 [Steroidobacteraceae bacterium]